MKKLIYILAGFVLILTSCAKDDGAGCFSSTGEIIEETRMVSSFNKLELHDNVSVILVQSDSNYAVVEAGENIISGIRTDVNDAGQMVIRNTNTCNWIRSYSKPLNVYLHYQDLDSIIYRSIGDVYTQNMMTTDTLWLEVFEGAGEINIDISSTRLYCSIHNGTADVYFTGQTGLQFLYSAGFGILDARDLVSTFAYVRNKSSNNLFVYSTKVLGVEINGIGDVYYKGNPDISLDKQGSGELIKLEP